MVRGTNVEAAIYLVKTVLMEWLVWGCICELKIKYKVRKYRRYAPMTFGECYDKEQETQLQLEGHKGQRKTIEYFCI